jgi:hypothetical protein
VYPDPEVADFVTRHFVPVRAHVKEQPDQYRQLGERFGADWTPTILVIDPGAEVRHRIEGFLPKDEFLAQLQLGLAHSAFSRGEFDRAAKQFEEVLARHSNSDAAAEAQYWAGVSRYKATGNGAELAETARRFGERYSNTTWAKKASVWME